MKTYLITDATIAQVTAGPDDAEAIEKAVNLGHKPGHLHHLRQSDPELYYSLMGILTGYGIYRNYLHGEAEVWMRDGQPVRLRTEADCDSLPTAYFPPVPAFAA